MCIYIYIYIDRYVFIDLCISLSLYLYIYIYIYIYISGDRVRSAPLHHDAVGVLSLNVFVVRQPVACGLEGGIVASCANCSLDSSDVN